ncbi:MAG: O-antigen ligase family protein [Patescibacteria group bacterium]|nr:O-antigen ligase family protein [Patescibacteria group bacterium]
MTTFFPGYKFFSFRSGLQSTSAFDEKIDLTFFASFADGVFLLFNYLLISRKRKLFKSFKPDLNWILLTIVVLLGAISSYFASYPIYSFFILYQLLKAFFMFVIFKELINKDANYLKSLIEIIGLFVTFNSILILMQAFKGGPLGLPVEGVFGFKQFGDYTDEVFNLYRPGGMTTSPNEMATVLAMFSPFFICMSLVKKKKVFFNNGFMMMVAFLSIIAVFFTMARAVWIGLFFTILFIVIFIHKNDIAIDIPEILFKSKRVLLAVCAILLPIGFLRLSTLKTTFVSSEGGWVYRLRHIQIAYNYMTHMPFGLGLDNFRYRLGFDYPSDYYLNDLTPPHNILAQIGASFGFMGLIVWLAFFYRIISKGFSLIGKYRESNNILLVLGSFSSVIMYLFVAQLHPWLIKKPIFYFFYLSLAILHSVGKLDAKNSQEKD